MDVIINDTFNLFCYILFLKTFGLYYMPCIPPETYNRTEVHSTHWLRPKNQRGLNSKTSHFPDFLVRQTLRGIKMVIRSYLVYVLRVLLQEKFSFIRSVSLKLPEDETSTPAKDLVSPKNLYGEQVTGSIGVHVFINSKKSQTI